MERRWAAAGDPAAAQKAGANRISVRVRGSSGLSVRVRVRDSNTEHNLVYPFYLEEG